MITTGLLMLFAVIATNRDVYLGKTKQSIHYAAVFLVFFNGVTSIPLFDGYTAKNFPFSEHLSYVTEVIDSEHKLSALSRGRLLFGECKMYKRRYTSCIKPEPLSGWEVRPHLKFIDGAALMSQTKGSALKFASRGCFDIKMLTHDWSGMAELYQDDSPIRKIDLYSVQQDAEYIVSIRQDNKPHSYTLEVTGEKQPESHAFQVWVDAILVPEDCSQ